MKAPEYHRHYGLLHVESIHHHDKDHMLISYAGNMGCGMGHVAECFDALYGKGSTDKLLSMRGKERGCPDYYWSKTVDRKAFDSTFLK